MTIEYLQNTMPKFLDQISTRYFTFYMARGRTNPGNSKFCIFELLGHFCKKSRVNSKFLATVDFELHSIKCWCSELSKSYGKQFSHIASPESPTARQTWERLNRSSH